MSRNKELQENIKSAERSVSTTQIDQLGTQAENTLTNAVESVTGQVAGQVEGGVQSLTQEAEKYQDTLNNLTTEGLLDGGVESLQNMTRDFVGAAASSLLGKFGANVSIEFSEPDSAGLVHPISSSFEEQGGVDGTISAVIQLITGLVGVDGGTLQKAVVDGSPEGLVNAGKDLNIEGKIGAFAADTINSLANSAIQSVSDELSTIVGSPVDLNRVVTYISDVDSDGAGNLNFIESTVTSTGPTADSEFTNSLTNLSTGVEDVSRSITSDDEVKTDEEGTKTSVKNLTGGKDPNEVIEAVNSTSLTQQKLSNSIDISNSLIQTRIAKDSQVGVIQGLSKEKLTDVKKRIKDFAPKISDLDAERVIYLAQSDAQDFSDAIKLLSDKTGKSYQVIRTFLKTIDTTITSATQPVPSDFVFEEPYVIGSFEKQWQNGQGDPKFPYISSVEELEAELKNVTREITEVVVHWTETPTNKNIGSEELNEIHLKSGLKGIGYHYVIRRDGSIQRGRPVNIEGDHALVNDHNKRSIGIVFVGGINVPSGTPNLENFVSVQSLTRSQFNSFDHFCRAFYSRFSGGQIIGHNDIDTNEEDPGFNVREYVLANFGKESKFTNPLKQSPFTIDEINNDE